METKRPKHFAVIGLGVFGSYLVRYLADQGAEIVGIDRDEKKVENVKEFLKVPIVCDATEQKQLEDAGINPKDIDVAVVSIGENVETSIYVTLILRDIGIKKIVARALNSQHAKILGKIGVDKVIYPEANAAEQLARHLIAPHIVEEFDLSEDHSITEVITPKDFYKKTLLELGIRTKYRVTIIGIRRKVPTVIEDTGETDIKEEVILTPEPEEELIEGDVLIVAGRNEDIDRIKQL